MNVLYNTRIDTLWRLRRCTVVGHSNIVFEFSANKVTRRSLLQRHNMYKITRVIVHPGLQYILKSSCTAWSTQVGTISGIYSDRATNIIVPQ